MTEIIYSFATTEDAENLASARVAFLTELLGVQDEDAAGGLAHELSAYFRKALPAQHYLGVIARQNGRLAATGGMVFREQPGSFKNPTGKTAYILNMYTLPEFRRKGISTAIMEQLMDIARSKGYNSFELHATPDGEPVYQKLGFYKHSEPTYRKHLKK